MRDKPSDEIGNNARPSRGRSVLLVARWGRERKEGDEGKVTKEEESNSPPFRTFICFIGFDWLNVSSVRCIAQQTSLGNRTNRQRLCLCLSLCPPSTLSPRPCRPSVVAVGPNRTRRMTGDTGVLLLQPQQRKMWFWRLGHGVLSLSFFLLKLCHVFSFTFGGAQAWYARVFWCSDTPLVPPLKIENVTKVRRNNVKLNIIEASQ